jgi:hypothetical protein
VRRRNIKVSASARVFLLQCVSHQTTPMERAPQCVEKHLHCITSGAQLSDVVISERMVFRCILADAIFHQSLEPPKEFLRVEPGSRSDNDVEEAP